MSVSTCSRSSRAPSSACARRRPSKVKGLVTTATAERPELARERGHDRGTPRAGCPAESGGDEHHVRALYGFENPLGILERGLPADLGIRTAAESFGELRTERNPVGRMGSPQAIADRCSRPETRRQQFWMRSFD